MNRANPKDLRKAMEAAHLYTKAGILFVPVPVMDSADHAALLEQAADRMERLAQEAERGEA